jgi:ribosome maturation protein SDO1
MKSNDSFNVARLKRGSTQFEIVVDPDLAVVYKEKQIGELRDILSSDQIYSDAKKGLVAADHELEATFKTTNTEKIAEAIIKQGEIQLTTEYREKKREEKRQKILGIITRNAVDPKTHLPHPMTRIENALVEARVKIDELKSAEDQVKDIVRKLQPILPIRFETKEIALKIPPDYAAKSYSVVTGISTILKQDWQSDGSWVVVVEVPGGMENDLYDKLNSLCHGNVESKLLKTK